MRVQANDADPWKTAMTIKQGESVNLGCMHDGSGQLADNVKIVAKYSDNSETTFPGNKVTAWKPGKTGLVSLTCTLVDCSSLKGEATLTVDAGCYECPSTYGCYEKYVMSAGSTLGTDEYKWFAPGYAMTDFVKVADKACTDRNMLKPLFKGKAKGDANCDGAIDQADYSIWRKEYIDEVKTNNRWEADFDCNNVVDSADYSNWRRFYFDFVNLDIIP